MDEQNTSYKMVNKVASVILITFASIGLRKVIHDISDKIVNKS